MQLSLHADYACRTLIYLTIEPRASVPQISSAFGISNNHLVKVVHRLSQAGYLKTTRGRGGGISLARSPKDISLADVIRDMEPSFDIVECFSSSTNTCRISRACGLKAVLEEATRAFLSTLEKYSLSDVIRDEKFLKRALVGATKSPSNKGTNAEMRNEMT